MSSVRDTLINLIKTRDALSVYEFMAFCLNDPEFGYYQRQPIFGQKGDFITAPEISQMFGELLGLWLAQSWIEQDCPGSFTLLELGPEGLFLTLNASLNGGQ